MLKPLTDQLVDGAEELTAGSVKRKLKKSRLPKEIVDELSVSAEWNKPAKNIVKVTAPRVAAKWLNKTGISAEYQDEVALITAAGTLAGGHLMLMRRLDELEKKMNPPIAPGPAKPAEEKK